MADDIKVGDEETREQVLESAKAVSDIWTAITFASQVAVDKGVEREMFLTMCSTRFDAVRAAFLGRKD